MIQSNFKKSHDKMLFFYIKLSALPSMACPKTALVRESALAGWPAGRKFSSAGCGGAAGIPMTWAEKKKREKEKRAFLSFLSLFLLAEGRGARVFGKDGDIWGATQCSFRFR